MSEEDEEVEETGVCRGRGVTIGNQYIISRLEHAQYVEPDTGGRYLMITHFRHFLSPELINFTHY